MKPARGPQAVVVAARILAIAAADQLTARVILLLE